MSSEDSDDSQSKTRKRKRHAIIGHEARWEDMFGRLLAFREEHGHCLVPNRYGEDPKLGAWVATQRRQYKALMSGCKDSTPMTPERAVRLQQIGFEWSPKDPDAVPWIDRFKELVAFMSKGDHTTGGMGLENVALSNWISNQRQEYKLLQRGLPSKLTPDRVKLLNELGFAWEPKKGLTESCASMPQSQNDDNIITKHQMSLASLGLPAVPRAAGSSNVETHNLTGTSTLSQAGDNYRNSIHRILQTANMSSSLSSLPAIPTVDRNIFQLARGGPRRDMQAAEQLLSALTSKGGLETGVSSSPAANTFPLSMSAALGTSPLDAALSKSLEYAHKLKQQSQQTRALNLFNQQRHLLSNTQPDRDLQLKHLHRLNPSQDLFSAANNSTLPGASLSRPSINLSRFQTTQEATTTAAAAYAAALDSSRYPQYAFAAGRGPLAQLEGEETEDDLYSPDKKTAPIPKEIETDSKPSAKKNHPKRRKKSQDGG